MISLKFFTFTRLKYFIFLSHRMVHPSITSCLYLLLIMCNTHSPALTSSLSVCKLHFQTFQSDFWNYSCEDSTKFYQNKHKASLQTSLTGGFFHRGKLIQTLKPNKWSHNEKFFPPHFLNVWQTHEWVKIRLHVMRLWQR